MSLLSVVRDVCAVVGVVQPTTVMGAINSTRTMAEMLALANEMAQRIAYDTRDWTKLRKTVVYQGDGVQNPQPPVGDGQIAGTISFDLPSNYQRMLLTSNIWKSTSTQHPMHFIADGDEWLKRRINNYLYGSWGEWTIMGGQIYLFPVMPIGVYATFMYLDKNCINLASGGYNDAFTDDGDVFYLGERLLKLGMVWQWKANKGTSYAEDMATYSDALAVAMGHDAPAPIIIGHPASRREGYGYAHI